MQAGFAVSQDEDLTMNTMDRLFKIAALLLAATCLMPLPALAQQIAESHLKAAYEAIETTRTTQQFDAILPSLGQRAKEELISSRPDAADQLTTIVDEATVSMAARRGNLEDEIARIYARTFSEEELRAITAFYLSDAGKKLIEQTPELANAVGQAAKVWAAGLQRDLALELRKRISEAELQ
jgi:uncharacterized protein